MKKQEIYLVQNWFIIDPDKQTLRSLWKALQENGAHAGDRTFPKNSRVSIKVEIEVPESEPGK